MVSRASVPEGVRLPGPSFGLPLLAAGTAVLIAAAFAGPLLLAAAAILFLLGGLRLAAELRREGSPYDRRAVLAARRIRRFGARHAVSGRTTVRVARQPLGQRQERLLLLGADGTYGDVVVGHRERAEAVITLAGAQPADATDRDFAGQIRTSRYEWTRMGGRGPARQ